MDGSPQALERLPGAGGVGRADRARARALQHRPGDAGAGVSGAGRRAQQAGAAVAGGDDQVLLDGVVESGTAWLFEPDSSGSGTAPFWPDLEAYREAVRVFDAAGFQCVTHAIGDRAAHEVLNAYRDAAAENGPRDRRHRIEHLETLRDADLGRARRRARDRQPAADPHAVDQRRRSRPVVARAGPGAAARGFRLADIRRSGAVAAAGVGLAGGRLRPAAGDGLGAPAPAAAPAARRPLQPGPGADGAGGARGIHDPGGAGRRRGVGGGADPRGLPGRPDGVRRPTRWPATRTSCRSCPSP